MTIKNNYLVEKSNVLLDVKNVNMSLQELRFFSIYLAKINARDISTRRVKFPLSDFQKIMGIGRMNIAHFKRTVDGLLCKVVHIPNNKGGLSSFQLFKEVELYKDDNETWIVEVDAHDKALPLMFNLKSNYFKYELWNALKLKSINQLQIYEMLKSYEKIGIFEITMSDLRERLCIKSNQYSTLQNFKVRILDSCQKALKENTDICYTYERGKVGNRGKWLTIVFHIQKNTEYKSTLNLEEFIKEQPALENHLSEKEQAVLTEIPIPPPPAKKLNGNLEKDLTSEEINVLCESLSYKVEKSSERTQDKLKERLALIYNNAYLSAKEPIKNAFAYLKAVVINISPEKLPDLKEEDDFDVDMYKVFINRCLYDDI